MNNTFKDSVDRGTYDFENNDPAHYGHRLASAFESFAQQWHLRNAIHDPESGMLVELRSVMIVDLLLISKALAGPHKRTLSSSSAALLSPVLRTLIKAKNISTATALLTGDRQAKVDEALQLNLSLLFLENQFPDPETRPTKECVNLFHSLLGALTLTVSDPAECARAALLQGLFAAGVTGVRPFDLEERTRACNLLGVNERFTAADLQAAYRQRVKEWHPDRLSGMAPELNAFANEKLKKVNEAFSFLQMSVQVGSDRQFEATKVVTQSAVVER